LPEIDIKVPAGVGARGKKSEGEGEEDPHASSVVVVSMAYAVKTGVRGMVTRRDGLSKGV
jgi:hypothetical protein